MTYSNIDEANVSDLEVSVFTEAIAPMLLAVIVVAFNLYHQNKMVDAFVLSIFPGGVVVMLFAKPLSALLRLPHAVAKSIRVLRRSEATPKHSLEYLGPLHKR